MAGRLKDKVAIVTGAGSRGPGMGNGKAAAILFAREGAKVLCVDAEVGRAEETVKMISDEGHAAMAGQGVAMLTPFLWRNDIAQGRLVRLSDQLSTRGFGYWLVYPEERRLVPKIKRFREWLLQEIEEERHDPLRAASSA